MRAKVVILAATAAVAILAPAIYYHFKSDAPPSATSTDDTSTVAAVEAAPPILKRIQQVRPSEGLSTAAEDRVIPAELSHDEYVAQRMAELSELGMSSDPMALKKVLPELENPDPEIRKAALNATVDFGSKDALPTLQNEYNWATDPQEKLDIQKAIDFLQLPALSTDDSTASTQQAADSSTPATN